VRVLGRVLAWLVVAGLVAVVVVAAVATRSGYRIEVVRSGSMVPAFAPGDAVVIGPVSGPIEAGQVVTFLHSNRSDDLVTHRVTDVTASGLVHTKGDANTTADVWDIRPEQVTGVERLVVPRLGYAIVFLRNPRGLGGLLCLLAALALLVQTLLAARRGEGPFDAVLGRHTSQPGEGSGAVDGSRATGTAWVPSAPPPGFGRLSACQYPCVVVEDDARWNGRVIAWQRSDSGWRAFVRVTRTGPDGRSRTTEQWLARSSLEPASG
jgi:signal peptidase I